MSTPAPRAASPAPAWALSLIHIWYDVTDELFGITIARPGYLNPYYTYGAILLAAPAWAIGTAPVSYTHLDVYKRQVLMLAVR